MGWRRTLTWRIACWAWVSLPIVGFLPGAIPVRLGTQWLSLASSMGVIGLSVACPRRTGQASAFGWMALACLMMALSHWRHPTPAFLWGWQTLTVLTAAALLAIHGDWAWLREAVIACAWMQVIVAGCQWGGEQGWWPRHPSSEPSGTVGSVTAASVIMGVGSLWSRGWQAWGLGVATCLMGSGTAIPVVVAKLGWSVRHRLPRWVLITAAILLVGVGAWRWHAAFALRWLIWQDWPCWRNAIPCDWLGVGFNAFPGGFADDTPFGKLMMWRDYHNVALDWVGRFGVLGLLVLSGLVVWGWRRSRGKGEWRWMGAFAAWVACWQSLEQFPVLSIPMLVWWVGLVQQAQRGDDAVAPT